MSATIMKVSYESVGSILWDDNLKLQDRDFKNEEGHFYLEPHQIDELIKEGEIDGEALQALRDNIDKDIGGIEFVIT